MSARDYDVLIATDLRHKGGTTASIAQEIEVQARMGLRTGLLQIDAPHLGASAWADRIQASVEAGLAEVVSPDRAVTARLLVLRHPRVFEHAGWRLAARADHVVMVANQLPQDGARPEPYYSAPAVAERLRAELGDAPPWAPIGPMVRDSLVAHGGPGVELTSFDWNNVIDASAWTPRTARPRDRSGPGVLGRHSRDDSKKWPERAEDLLAAYPDRADQRVRVLGGAEAARRVLGRIPAAWEVLGFGSLRPEELLAGLDVYVYFHHSGWREAFGRAVLEALAAGLPVVTHPYFERLFGDTCVYCEPRDAPAEVTRLLDERPFNQPGVELVRERYDWERHRQRLARYLSSPPAPIARASPRRRRILFVSSNGGGMGHLTRLLAIARRLPSDCEPLFITQSSAIEAVRKLGFWVDYVPPLRASGLGVLGWHQHLRARVSAALRLMRAEAVVFDGTFAYKGLVQALHDFPHVRRIWSRRAMWRPITAERAIHSREQADAFDLIIEPGELAARVDRGFTTTQRDRVSLVEPVLYLDPSEALPREEARAELGIAPGAVAALVNLGAGNINRLDEVLAAIADLLGRDPALHIVAIQSLIARRGLPVGTGRVSRLETYPLSRVIRAFDFCVAAPGYNSFHELLASAVPTVFIPNEQTDMDDQVARAAWAEEEGVGRMARESEPRSLEAALTAMLDPAVRAAIQERCRALPGCDGARQAAALVAATGWVAPARAPLPASLAAPAPALARRSRPIRRRLWHLWRRVRLAAAWLRGARDPSGAVGLRPSPSAPPLGNRVLVVAGRAEPGAAQVQALVDWVAEHHAGAVVLAPADALPALSKSGVTVELLVDADAAELSDRLERAAYVRWKADAVRAAYGCGTVVTWGEPGERPGSAGTGR